MSLKNRLGLTSSGSNPARKSKKSSDRPKRRSVVLSTSWFIDPEGISPTTTKHASLVKTKSTGDEASSSSKFKHSRKFGSTGDLLDVDTAKQGSGFVKKDHRMSLEQLPTSSSMTSEVGPFRIETGLECKRGEICNLLPLSLHKHAFLENPENETRWYFKYFLGKYHLNYLCYDVERNPLFLSVVPSDSLDSLYRCILWRKTGNKRLCVKHSSNGKWPSPKSILEKFSVKHDRNIKEIFSPCIQKELLTLEEQEGSVNFKFGVLYAKAGQITDNAMYSNENGSVRFHQFLELLGDEVQLRGWQQFRGGLDCKNDSTGLSSVYTVFEGHEIMFHVSTLLPYTTANQQQLERKRHLGNDIVVIIYVDYDIDPEEAYKSAITNFNPSYMRSHFNHIFALVTYNHLTESYHLVVHSAESVPAFGPPLPMSGEFTDVGNFRDFLLAKLINGEKAAYCTPTFAQKRERTLGLLLKDVEKNFTQEMRRAVSTPTLNNSPSSYKKYNEKEQAFTEFGQRLKVEKIITGLHPTSQRTSGTAKREPWETECVAENFPYKICYADACDNGTLVVHTQNDGSYFVFKDGSYSLIIDQSVSIGQLAVAHRHQLLLFRTNYQKEVNFLYAIPLKEFYNDQAKVAAKSSISQFQIPYSKGVTLFCTSPLHDQFLRLAVAVKTKVFMLAYKHPANMVLDGLPMTPPTSNDPKLNFIKHRELTLLDVPLHMTLLDERPSGKLCVTYQKLTVVDAIDEIMATTRRIPLDLYKTKLTTLTSVQNNGRSELLIGYNLTCQLMTLQDSTAYNSVEITWNTEPQSLVCLPPYMLAFTEHTVEIRMASNGSLIQTLDVPDLKLISSKGDIYFTSSSMIHVSSNKTPTSVRSFNIPSKLPKNVDKKDFVASGKLMASGKNSEGSTVNFIYKINMENMTGRKDLDTGLLEGSVSLQNSGSEESVSRTEFVFMIPSDSADDNSLDYIYPVLEDEDVPMIKTSFEGDQESIVISSPYRRTLSDRVAQFTKDDLAHENNRYTDVGSERNKLEIVSSGDLSRQTNSSMFKPIFSSYSSPSIPSESSPYQGGKFRSKVVTSRNSLETRSQWSNPYLPPPAKRDQGLPYHGNACGYSRMDRCGNGDVTEVLGVLKKVVYSSADGVSGGIGADIANI